MDGIKKKIRKRIDELRKKRETLTGHNSKTKYNYCIGELQGVLEDLDEL